MASDLDALLNPPARQDALTRWLVEEAGYDGAQRLPDGSYATLNRLVTTLGICLGVDKVGWARRFCYRDASACLAAWANLRTRDDELEGWIARRPE